MIHKKIEEKIYGTLEQKKKAVEKVLQEMAADLEAIKSLTK